MEEECRFEGPANVLFDIFGALDEDDSGKVGFDELQAWISGRKTRRGKSLEAIGTITLADRVVEAEDAWDEQRLRAEIRLILQAWGVQATDVVRAWDQSGDNVISRSEFLQNMISN